jgi:predicted regulator of Ras-like GTPase activity (Roadblock/LC7/MglB family)
MPQSLRPAMPVKPAAPVAPVAPIAPAHLAMEPVAPVPEGPFLTVAMSPLLEGWPEALRQEVLQLNLLDAKVGLPVPILEQSLKRGKVSFPWKTVRSWIRPAPLPMASAHDEVALELPLKVILPLFLAHKKQEPKANQQKVEIDENIPNLFFGFPQAETAGSGTDFVRAQGVAAVQAPSAPGLAPTQSVQPTQPAVPPAAGDTNYYVWDDNSDSARVDESDVKKPVRSGTDFSAKHATPNEIVSRAAAMEGVAGALVALPDGLLVASKMSQDLNADTLAGFLPQIFGKVSQCTKELRMGELNNLNFTVGNIPWKIFRVNAIFFAAFGRVGQPLPTAQLAALAAELDHKR